MTQNVVTFTREDAEKVAGRPLTDDEYRGICKAAEFSMPQEFAELVTTVLENDLAGAVPKKVPDAVFDLEGKSFGGQYWNEETFRITLVDLGETWGVYVEDQSGGRVNAIEGLGAEEAEIVRRFAGNAVDRSGSPLLHLSSVAIWELGNGQSETVELRDFDEVGAWLSYWTGETEWDWTESGTEWEW